MTDADPVLGILARADAERLKRFAEDVLGDLADIEVLQNRTGLVMLPMRDTAQGTAFHLGEVLVSEAQIRSGGISGYGMRQGTDLEAAVAMAVVDLALSTGVQTEACHEFCRDEQRRQSKADTLRLRKIEATRVDMETF